MFIHYERREHEDFDCPNCEFIGEPIVEEERYGTDRDGNRGMDLTTIRCPICDYEKAL